MGWAEHVASMEEMRNVYKILVGKHEWKRQLRRPRHRHEVNIRMDLREMVWTGFIWLTIGTCSMLL